MHVFTKATDIKIMHMNRVMISLYLSPWDSQRHSASRTIGTVTNTGSSHGVIWIEALVKWKFAVIV